jgi:hypothetical protein
MRYIETLFGFSFDSSYDLLIIMLVLLVVVAALRYGALR